MKFFNLLKKELSELINAQAILSLAISLLMFFVLGQVMNNTMEEAINQQYVINIVDNDKTELTHELMEALKESGAELTSFEVSGSDYAEILSQTGKETIILIPKGFTEDVENNRQPELIRIEGMNSAAMMNNVGNDTSGAVNMIVSCISDIFAERSGLSDEDIEIINKPVSVVSTTVIGNKSAFAGKLEIASQLMSQSMIIPVIVLMLIIMTSQTLISAIANEKIDKTLETLLSAPVSRMSILSAKMLAAAVVALLNAVVFMIGFSFMMNGATATAVNEISSSMGDGLTTLHEAMGSLGLTLGAGDYILVGIQLFFTIMICLCISLMLGTMVNDTKQSQTIVMPLMFAVLIPYMISLFTDIGQLPIVIRIFVYAIPFTHTFSAMSNIMFGHMGIFWAGLAYQAVAFAVCMFFAVRLFKSDIILTASFNFGQKSKYKKGAGSEE